MAFTQVPISGTIKLPGNNAPAAGAFVTFTLNTPMTDGTTLISPTPVQAVCATDGTFTITLPANDDTTTTPTGTFYSVVISSAAAQFVPLDQFNIIVPKADVAGVNLFALATLINPGSVSAFVSKIVAGSNVTISPTTGVGAVTINSTGGGGGGSSLAPTAVKTANYTAAASDFVPCDVSAAGFTVTLPTAPADKAQIGVKIIGQASTPNTLTINRGGSDVFNKAGGSTSLALTLLFQDVILQYQASSGIWYALSSDMGNGPPTGQEKVEVLGSSFSNVRWSTLVQASADFFAGELQSDGSQNAEVVFQKYLQAGTYTMDLFHKIGTTRGIYSIFIDGVQLGTTIDGYTGGATTSTFTPIANITITGSTVHTIRLVMATHNASSLTPFYLGVIHGITFTRTGS